MDETAANIEVYDQDPGKDDFIGRFVLLLVHTCYK